MTIGKMQIKEGLHLEADWIAANAPISMPRVNTFPRLEKWLKTRALQISKCHLTFEDLNNPQYRQIGEDLHACRRSRVVGEQLVIIGKAVSVEMWWEEGKTLARVTFEDVVIEKGIIP